MHRALLALALALSACSDAIGIDAFFTDELVEAPARGVDVTVLSPVECDTVLGKTVAEARAGSGVLAKRETRYPVDPTDDSIFDDLPTDQLLTFDVSARDDGGLQVGRGCARVRIDDLEAAPRIELRALPACTTPVSRADVSLVIDTSLRMGLADQEANHIPDFNMYALDPVAALPNTLWSFVTYGHADLAGGPTTDLMSIRDQLAQLEGIANGQPRLFDAVAHAAELSRARAVCGTKSVLVVLASYSDEGSKRPFDDALVGIVGTRGDLTDDLFLIGIALTNEGYTDLDALAPMPTDALVTGAGTRAQRQQTFRDVRDKIIELSRPPME